MILEERLAETEQQLREAIPFVRRVLENATFLDQRQDVPGIVNAHKLAGVMTCRYCLGTSAYHAAKVEHRAGCLTERACKWLDDQEE